MTLIILFTAAAGLAIFITGLPFLRAERLEDRTLPYLRKAGSGGRGKRTWIGGRTIRPSVRRDIEGRLEASGSAISVETFRMEQVVWAAMAVAGLAFAVGLALTAGLRPNPSALLVLAVITAAIGFVARDRRLSQEAQRRSERAIEELPVAIDLLTLAVMSGETIPAACDRVGRVVSSAIGPEFQRVAADIRSGRSTVEALELLGARLPHPAIGRLVDSLCVAMERGAPLADTLRAQADDLRDVRRRMLLEQGGRREILMLVPVVFLILPTVVLFALFPGLATLDLLVP